MLAVLAQGAALGLSAAALPGPFQAYLLAEAAGHGWRRSLPLAWAPLLSDGPIIATVLLLLSQVPNMLLDVLRLAGGAFILWLAYRAFRSLGELQVATTAFGGVLKGAVMNFLNPNPWIFWALVGGPLFIDAWRRAGTLGLGFLASFYLVMIGTLALLIVLFALAAGLGQRVRRGLVVVSGLSLAAFGGYQLVRGVLGLI